MNSEDASHAGSAAWVSWLLGAALLGSVVVAAWHFTEERAFLALFERARPGWLVAAIALQLGTYIAQGGIWRRVVLASGGDLPRRTAYELSLAKLFADQALPSAGVSSSVLVARALDSQRLPGPAVKAAVLINLTSYHLAYVVALGAAVAVLTTRGQLNAFVFTTALVFFLFSIALGGGVLALAGRPALRFPPWLLRAAAVRRVVAFMAGADIRLLHAWRVLADTIVLQLAIVLLDATTLWCLLRALDTHSSLEGVFACFMVASLFRTMGILPGGLGTFEATSVVMLRLIGLDVAIGLSATLLFRGLSFWLPMLPGYWYSRRFVARPRA